MGQIIANKELIQQKIQETSMATNKVIDVTWLMNMKILQQF